MGGDEAAILKMFAGLKTYDVQRTRSTMQSQKLLTCLNKGDETRVRTLARSLLEDGDTKGGSGSGPEGGGDMGGTLMLMWLCRDARDFEIL